MANQVSAIGPALRAEDAASTGGTPVGNSGGTETGSAGVTSVASAKGATTSERAANATSATSAEGVTGTATAAPYTSQGSALIKNIVSTETGEDQGSILGEAPKYDSSLLQDLSPPSSLTLVVIKLVFWVLLIASIVSVLFFSSQLTDTFDIVATRFGIPNTSKNLASSNEELTQLQTDLNMYQYLQLKAYFDRFSYDGDSYSKNYEIANSQTSANPEKNQAQTTLQDLRSSLDSSLALIRENFAENFSVPLIDPEFSEAVTLNTLFEDKLRNRLLAKSSELANSDNPQARRDYKNYTQAINLAGNTELQNLVIGTDFVTLSDEEVYNFIKKVNSLTINDLSIIQTIKDQRIKWSDIINEIDLRTIAVDSYYDENFYESLGGIRYTSYDFDSGARSINITGETKRFDTTNFTMIANLIDELNRSEFFEDGAMRSFSKSGSLEDGYTATLKLSLNLQDEAVAEADEIVELEVLP